MASGRSNIIPPLVAHSTAETAAREAAAASANERALSGALQEIVRAARSALRLERVILFGSRARGDARPDSDIDLAFEHRSSDAEWAAFVNDMADRAPTLAPLDLVDLSRVEPRMRGRIEAEGRTLHG